MRDRRFDVSVGVLLVVVALLFQAVAFAQILMPPRPPPSGPPLPRGPRAPPGPQSAPPSGGSGGVVRGLPTRFPRGFGAAATPLPDTDFVWTWGEPSADDEEIATRVREDGFVIVRVEGRQDAHSCELIAELVDFLNPDSERVRTMKRALEGLAGDRDFASRVKSLMDAQASTSVLRGARMSCVVSPSQKELRARERARASQERRRSR